MSNERWSVLKRNERWRRESVYWKKIECNDEVQKMMIIMTALINE